MENMTMEKTEEFNKIADATYSPEDNKIRLYCEYRLDDDEYQKVKKAGFRWAPKQDLFVAHWSCGAEDIALEFAGEIEPEDKTLLERAEDKAERLGRGCGRASSRGGEQGRARAPRSQRLSHHR